MKANRPVQTSRAAEGADASSQPFKFAHRGARIEKETGMFAPALRRLGRSVTSLAFYTGFPRPS